MKRDRVFVIAEAGVNHNGSLASAIGLVDAAVEAGADAVKFQTFSADRLVLKTAQKAEYQKATTGAGETQYEMLKRLELSKDDHLALAEHCRRRGIMFLSTAFDCEGVRYLDSLGIPIFKIPSGEITNLPYLRAVAACGKPMILSTGMSTMDEVRDAVVALGEGRDITLLHCTTEYPCPLASVNLKAMVTMRDEFGLFVGYSDHTIGIEVPIAAVAMGVRVIEKHFTLDRNQDGPDHKASLEPDELASMIAAIRNVEAALGNGIKTPDAVEQKNIAVARKSIVARVPIRKGELFTEANLTVKRPGMGLSPMLWDKVVGSVANRDYVADENI
ncbi:MAG: N-acetylneuraminate synthase [Kiritimatiellae bacterium]|nr:N-acetylneuraminate synthase [Kiritimatiellia bacterium]